MRKDFVRVGQNMDISDFQQRGQTDGLKTNMNDNPDTQRFVARKYRNGLKIVRIIKESSFTLALTPPPEQSTSNDTVVMKPALAAAIHPFFE
ncbi:MAG: hypothetical protein ACPGVU_21910 [Limisphaerales bacterium]